MRRNTPSPSGEALMVPLARAACPRTGTLHTAPVAVKRPASGSSSSRCRTTGDTGASTQAAGAPDLANQVLTPLGFQKAPAGVGTKVAQGRFHLFTLDDEVLQQVEELQLAAAQGGVGANELIKGRTDLIREALQPLEPKDVTDELDEARFAVLVDVAQQVFGDVRVLFVEQFG